MHAPAPWSQVLYPGGLPDCFLTHLLIGNGHSWLDQEWPIHFLSQVWDQAHDNQEGHVPLLGVLTFTQRLWPKILTGLN